MIYLAGSILLTSYLTLSFKITQRFHISNLQVLFFIAVASTITGILIEGSLSFIPAMKLEGWFSWSILIGILFIALFLLIAFVAQYTGVAIAAAASRLSLVVPFGFSILYYKEPVTIGKLTGIVVILIAVWMICRPPDSRQTHPQHTNGRWLLLPGLIFSGSGLRDIIVKYVQERFFNQQIQLSFLITSFAVAAVTAGLYLAIRLLVNKEKFNKRSMVAGVIIGIPAWFSFWCMIKFLQQYEQQSSIVIPFNNLGIVLVTTVVGFLFFKEKLSITNRIGIGLSVAGIVLLAFF